MKPLGSALFSGVSPHLGSREPPLYPGSLIIVDQRRELYWGGGGRGEVLLIANESRNRCEGRETWKLHSNKPD